VGDGGVDKRRAVVEERVLLGSRVGPSVPFLFAFLCGLDANYFRQEKNKNAVTADGGYLLCQCLERGVTFLFHERWDFRRQINWPF